MKPKSDVSPATFKEYIARINKVIDYIYRHLDHALTATELAREANFSEFHFQRIFKMVVGESLNVC